MKNSIKCSQSEIHPLLYYALLSSQQRRSLWSDLLGTECADGAKYCNSASWGSSQAIKEDQNRRRTVWSFEGKIWGIKWEV